VALGGVRADLESTRKDLQAAHEESATLRTKMKEAIEYSAQETSQREDLEAGVLGCGWPRDDLAKRVAELESEVEKRTETVLEANKKTEVAEKRISELEAEGAKKAGDGEELSASSTELELTKKEADQVRKELEDGRKQTTASKSRLDELEHKLAETEKAAAKSREAAESTWMLLRAKSRNLRRSLVRRKESRRVSNPPKGNWILRRLKLIIWKPR